MVLRILVCEDDAQQRDLLSAALGAQGYEVLMAADGEEALALAQRERPDLVLADLMMPGLDGASLGARLKADPRTAAIPFILSSAASGYEQAGDGHFRADAYLAKPWPWDQLFELLARLLK